MDAFDKPPDQWTDAETLEIMEKIQAPAVKYMLGTMQGPLLSEQEIEDLATDALMRAARTYDRAKGASARTYFERIVRRAALDTIARNRVRLKVTFDSDVAAEALVDRAEDETIVGDSAFNVEAAKAFALEQIEQLPDRMRVAVRHRFLNPDSSSWAKELAEARGGTPKSWRKASDDGLNKLRDRMRAAGFPIEERNGGASVKAAITVG